MRGASQGANHSANQSGHVQRPPAKDMADRAADPGSREAGHLARIRQFPGDFKRFLAIFVAILAILDREWPFTPYLDLVGAFQRPLLQCIELP